MFKVFNDSVPVRSMIRCYRDLKGTKFFCVRVVSARCVYGILYGDCPYSGEASYFSIFRNFCGDFSVFYQDFSGIIQPISDLSEWYVKAENYHFPSCTD